MIVLYDGNLPFNHSLMLHFMITTFHLQSTYHCSYTGWLMRGMVSATSFTLIGVVNKFLTVLLNVLVWDKHSTPLGILACCMCLLAGVFYQQSPRRDEAHKSSSEEAVALMGRGDGLGGSSHSGSKEILMTTTVGDKGGDSDKAAKK